MWVRNTLTIWSNASKQNTNLPKTGQGICIVVSSGIIPLVPSIFQCQATSQNCCTSISIASPWNYNVAHTLRAPKQYGKQVQAPLPVNISPKLSLDDVKQIQHIVGSILYHAWVMDITVLMALSSIAIKQTNRTTNTMEKAKYLLHYLATNPITTIWYRTSDMIMNVHSDTSYLSEAGARSRACGHFFMGWNAKDGNPIKLNGAFFTLCAILCFVVASATEAKLGALFLNCKEGMILWMTLEELSHPQPKIQICCNNATPVGIANNTLKRQHLQSMEMRCFGVCDKIAQDAYSVKWHCPEVISSTHN